MQEIIDRSICLDLQNPFVWILEMTACLLLEKTSLGQSKYFQLLLISDCFIWSPFITYVELTLLVLSHCVF